MRRLFFALWPTEQTRANLNRINQQIHNDQLRKLSAGNLHATLVFMGNVDEALVTNFCEQASKLEADSFTVVFDQLSFWPRPRVLCLTCQRQPKALYDLVNKLSELVEKAGVVIDKRPYRAHITLARKAKHAEQISFEPIAWHANDFALVESLSSEQGVEYKVLAKWPLRPA